MIDLVLIGEGVALSKIVNYAENSNAFRLKIVFSDSLKKKNRWELQNRRIKNIFWIKNTRPWNV